MSLCMLEEISTWVQRQQRLTNHRTCWITTLPSCFRLSITVEYTKHWSGLESTVMRTQSSTARADSCSRKSCICPPICYQKYLRLHHSWTLPLISNRLTTSITKGRSAHLKTRGDQEQQRSSENYQKSLFATRWRSKEITSYSSRLCQCSKWIQCKTHQIMSLQVRRISFSTNSQ